MMLPRVNTHALCLTGLLTSLAITTASANNLGNLFGNNGFAQMYNNEDENEQDNNFNRIPHYNDFGDQEEKSFPGAFSGNALPQAPPGLSPQGHGDYVAPKYMIELYNKFDTDRYSHPMANIVRSFVNINDDPLERENINMVDSKTPTRRHIMKFNISSVTRDDEIHLAELRLYTLVEADRNSYYGNDRKVELFQHVDDALQENLADPYELLDSKEIYGSFSGWETFTITDAVKSWARNEVQVKVMEIRISTIYPGSLPAYVNIETQPHRENEPLLVVFSNDKRKIKSEKKELHEIIMHYESEFGSLQDSIEYEYYDEEYDDDEIHNVNKRDTEAVEDIAFNSTSERTHINAKRVRKPYNSTEMLLAYKKQKLRDMYTQIMDMKTEIEEDEENQIDKSDPKEDEGKTRRRQKRSAGKRKKRMSCRKKALRVNFQDIKWDNWIIAPKGYDAYECMGRCNWPLSDHLTPTKHAIIQTLLHINFPKKAQRACCVPTQLAPISVLYVDEQGVVTYKYKYEGMVVEQCGCR